MLESDGMDTHCTCGRGPRRCGQSTCLACHREQMKGWRRTHPLTPEQRRRAITRSYANVYQRRGYFTFQPCSVCGSTGRTEKHHDDYTKPLVFRWFCRPCRVKLNRMAQNVITHPT